MTKRLKTGWPLVNVRVITMTTVQQLTTEPGHTTVGIYRNGRIWPLAILMRGRIEISAEHATTPLIMHELQHAKDALDPRTALRRIFTSRRHFNLWRELRADAVRIWYTPHGDKTKAIYDHTLHLAQTYNTTQAYIEKAMYKAGQDLGFFLYSEFNAEKPPWVS